LLVAQRSPAGASAATKRKKKRPDHTRFFLHDTRHANARRVFCFSDYIHISVFHRLIACDF
jgi:hypothetical protein